MTLNKKRSGFTLIELLVVIAILATIAGGILVSYDGLETDAAQAQATFNISAVDRAVRTFRTLNKVYPNELDSLLYSADGDGSDGVALNLLPSKLKEKVGPYTLTAEGVSALNAVGINRVRYVTGSYNNTTDTVSIPNRVFDNPTRGFGAVQTLGAGQVLAAIETKGGVTAFSKSAPPADSSRLRDICGLDQDLTHIVVALGLGNNSTMVSDGATEGVFGTLSEAPYYTNITKAEYGRYLLLYHLATDRNGNGTIEANEYFAEARFVAVLDTKGDWLDEEYAEYTNQKQ